jgi:hypothetical protein
MASSRKILSINWGFSFNVLIFWSALSIITVGSFVKAMVLRNSKASLSIWYPAAIVVWISFCSFSVSAIWFGFSPAFLFVKRVYAFGGYLCALSLFSFLKSSSFWCSVIWFCCFFR